MKWQSVHVEVLSSWAKNKTLLFSDWNLSQQGLKIQNLVDEINTDALRARERKQINSKNINNNRCREYSFHGNLTMLVGFPPAAATTTTTPSRLSEILANSERALGHIKQHCFRVRWYLVHLLRMLQAVAVLSVGCVRSGLSVVVTLTTRFAQLQVVLYGTERGVTNLINWINFLRDERGIQCCKGQQAHPMYPLAFYNKFHKPISNSFIFFLRISFLHNSVTHRQNDALHRDILTWATPVIEFMHYAVQYYIFV